MKYLFVFLVLITYSGFAQNISVDQKLGAEGKAEVETLIGFYNDPEKAKSLSAIGNKLVGNLVTKPFPYEFHIVDMGEPNAFALPGGYIFFTRGILALANSEDELAGVMGHEIIHSNNRHTVKQRKKILPGLLKLPGAVAGAVGMESIAGVFTPLSRGGDAIMASHSRKHETEADQLGVQLSAKSGYDPLALGTMLSTLTGSIEIFTGQKEKHSYFADHPLTPDRVQKIAKESAKLTVNSSEKIFKDRAAFLQFIDGIMVGPNPKQGVFVGNWFMHPDLNFKLKMPAAWLRQNSTTSVGAVDSTESGILLLEVDPKATSTEAAAKEFVANFQKKTGTTLTIDQKKINGNDARVVDFTTQQQGSEMLITVVWIEYQKTIYKIIGGAAPAFKKEVESLLESFSALEKSERDSITKRIINVVQAKEGETFAALSKRTNNVINPELTASINGMKPDRILKAGELVKVVIQVPY